MILEIVINHELQLSEGSGVDGWRGMWGGLVTVVNLTASAQGIPGSFLWI
jgi:hypothetical protein